MIGWGEAAVLGVLQGLTEFLPISSSAHLRIAAPLLGWADPGAAFETAVLLYFRADIRAIATAWTRSLARPSLRADPAARMGWFILVGTLPIGVLGFVLQDSIETAFRDLRIIGVTLVAFGLVLGAADPAAANTRPLESMTLRHALAYSAAQALALVPGVSRSGGTISAGLLLGYLREAAARYAFLLAVPAVLASGALELFNIGEAGAPAWGPTLLATGIAFAVGYAVIAWLLRYLARGDFRPFVVYRVLLGLGVLALVQAGALPALP